MNPRLKRALKVALIASAAGVALVAIGIWAFLNPLKPYWEMKGNWVPTFDFDGDRQFDRLEKSRSEQTEAEKSSVPMDRDGPAWPSYRGAARDGRSAETGLLRKWPKGGPPRLYRQPIGKGYAGFVIGLGRAWTIEQRRDKEAVTCYDFHTGAELWSFTYDADFREQLGGDGPRATPELDGERLYSLGAEGDLYCLDALDGNPIWSVNILEQTGSTNLNWGMSGAPLVSGGKLFVTASGRGGPSVLAYDKMTGKPLWTALQEQQAYTSLMEVDLAGRRQLLNVGASKINGLDPETGELLWSFPWTTDNGINCAQPLLAGERRVFVSSGYSKGCAMIELTNENGALQANEVYANINMKNKFNSSILHEGYVYGLDEAILACIELATGQRKWKGKRYHHGQILYADGHIIVLAENGDLALVRADPDAFEEVSRFHAIDGKTWNVPALAGGLLLVRNAKEMACFDLRGE